MRFCGRFNYNSCTWKENIVKCISLDAIIPLFTVPTLTFIASQNLICTIFILVMTPLFIYYIYRNFLRFYARTKFFLMWTITSVLMLMLIFEQCVVPLLEILPEENYVFIICVVGGLICGFKTKQNAEISQEITLVQEIELVEDLNKSTCNICKKYVPLKAFHCKLCQTCVVGREYHCKWLDCCVGANNLRWYLMYLFLSAIAFIYGSNLTMTTVCHPFIFIGTILLPDDCSDVYYQLDMAICFVSSLYSLLIGLVVLCYLIYHFWLLYLGTTSTERQINNSENICNKAVLKNVIQVFCCDI